MLTGSLPAVDYRPPSHRSRIDPRLDEIVARCLREEQSERYASVAELHAGLARIAASPNARRNRIMGLAAGVTLLITALWFGRVRLGLVDLPPPPPGTPIDGVPIAVAPFSPVEARLNQQRWADHLHLPVEFTNSIGMKFMLIPPGEYLRGRGDAEFDSLLSSEPKPRVDGLRKNDSSTPAHRVRLTRAFYLGTTEVTQGQYASITGQALGYFRVGNKGEAQLEEPDTRQLPVENLAYRYVSECCQLLSKAEGIDPAVGYRLPTEAQWEFALRAGTTTRFWYGREIDYAVRFEVSAWAKFAHTSRVASRIANPFGLYDMDGNVSEYCSDWWSPDEYKRLAARKGYPAIDPAGPSDADAPRGGSTRVVRGGNYDDLLQSRSSGMRAGNNPHVWYSNVGFRMSLPIEGARAIIARGDFEPAPRSDGAPVGAPPGLTGTGSPLTLQLMQQAWADYLGIPVRYINAAGMEFTLIPPGWYGMGCKPDQLDALPPPPRATPIGERPIDPYRWARSNQEQAVTLTLPLYVAVTETTRAQYASVALSGTSAATVSPATLDNEVGRLPAAMVTWHDAVALARALNDFEHIDSGAEGGYRLPTEAEWEFFARTGTNSRYPWGEDSEALAGYAHTLRTADSPYLDGPREVAGLQANAFGLCDTIGNVWEWCSDWASTQMQQTPAEGGHLINPPGPHEPQIASPPAAQAGVGERIIKGGGYLSPPQELRSAHRSGMSPESASPQVGFRLVIPAHTIAAKLKSTHESM
jgi:formylglycine-generating enzyme required for sulfatase activity